MRLWFAPSSEVPIYRQMATQVALAILSGDLQPGDKLPSTRELARRFKLHPNTISAGYRQLEREGWTEQRRGSGVYVRAHAAEAVTPEQILDRHIAGFFRAARELKLPQDVVRKRVAEWLAAPSPDHVLLVEEDAEARRILLTELRAAAKLPVHAVAMSDCDEAVFAGAIPVCRPSQEMRVRAIMPAGVELTPLPIRSATAWLGTWFPEMRKPAVGGVLVGIASRWEEFMNAAQTMLVAAGIPAEGLMVRDARNKGWQRGLEQARVLLCDAHTAAETLPKGPQVVVFPLLAEGGLEQVLRG